jgi:acyl-CoA dehydrogenase
MSMKVHGQRPIAQTENAEPRSARRIREFIASSLRPEAEQWEQDGAVPASVFRRLGDVGAWAARWPDGARSAGDVTAGDVTIREIAISSFGAAVAISIHQEAFFRALDRSEWGSANWGPAIAGEVIGALAVSERGSASNPADCRTTGRRSGQGWVLSGHKHYVSNAPAATDLAVFARTSERTDLTAFTIFVVPKAAPGVDVTRHRMVGAAASGTAMVDLHEVAVGDERIAGSVGMGLPLLIELLRGERLAAASSCAAVAELCFEVALAWADRRIVHGRAVRHHQSIAHRLAALQSEVACGGAFLRERLELARSGRVTPGSAAQAKHVLAGRAVDETIQLVGGHGYLEETALARLWRDVRLGRIGGGTDEVQLELVARSLRSGPLLDHPLVRAVAALADQDA